MNDAPSLSGDQPGAATIVAARPWLAATALMCAMLCVAEMLNDGVPNLATTGGMSVLGLLGIALGGLSIRQQRFERTASAAVIISFTSLLALAGVHLQ